MDLINKLLEELSKLPDVSGVAAADDTGSYLTGINIDDADEFSAILAFVGRSGVTMEELLGFDQLGFISLSGEKAKVIVHKVNDSYIGVRLKENAVVSKQEKATCDIINRLG